MLHKSLYHIFQLFLLVTLTTWWYTGLLASPIKSSNENNTNNLVCGTKKLVEKLVNSPETEIGVPEYDDIDDEEEGGRYELQNELRKANEQGSIKNVTTRSHVKRAGIQPKVWDQWGKWSCCSTSCDPGKLTRWRHCVSGGCAHGEKEAQIKSCKLKDC